MTPVPALSRLRTIICLTKMQMRVYIEKNCDNFELSSIEPPKVQVGQFEFIRFGVIEFVERPSIPTPYG